KLDVPRELVVRSHTREPRARSGRERHASSAYSAPRQPVDDFFYKPYEPSAAAPDTGASRPAPRSGTPKRPVAALLGGSRKPQYRLRRRAGRARRADRFAPPGYRGPGCRAAFPGGRYAAASARRTPLANPPARAG